MDTQNTEYLYDRWILAICVCLQNTFRLKGYEIPASDCLSSAMLIMGEYIIEEGLDIPKACSLYITDLQSEF